MITVQINRGDIHYISNNHHFYSSSNHHVGIRTDFPYTIGALQTKVANLTIPSIRDNSELITINKNNTNEGVNPITFYKSFMCGGQEASLGTEGKKWNRVHVSSNCIFLGDQAITIDPNGNGMVLPAQRSLNLVNSNHHIFYASPKKYILPPGILIPYGGQINMALASEDFQPKGYLPCDGRLVSTVAYPALFGILGYNYGGSGNMFGVPDFRARSPYGYDTSIPVNQFKGGSSNQTLDAGTTMPRHLHTIQYLNGDNPVSEGSYGLIRRSQLNIYTSVRTLSTGYSNYVWNLTDPPRGGTFSTEFTGNVPTTPFNVLHPYVLVHFLIKT